MNIKLLMIDLNIKLYSPHREFVLSEIFHQKKNSKRLNVSNVPTFNLEKELYHETSHFNPDVIFIDPWIMFNDKRDTSFLNANFIFDTNFNQRCQLISSFLKKDTTKLKIIFGGWMDVHSLSIDDTTEMKNLLSRKDFYLWGLGKNSFVEFEQTKQELIKTKRPHTKYFRSIILNTNLEKKIIPYLHSIPQNFFHKVSNEKKFEDYEFDFNVPGSLGAYPNRRKAQEILLKTNDKRYFSLLELNYILRNNFNKKKGQTLLELINYTYYDLITKSRVNYVDGGKMQYVTMKYLEVLMCRSLIFSPINQTLDEYGFVSGEHYINCNSSFELNLNIDSWNELYQHNLCNAYNLVNERHTTHNRVNQLIYMINEIIKNNQKKIEFSYKSGFLYQNNKIINNIGKNN